MELSRHQVAHVVSVTIRWFLPWGDATAATVCLGCVCHAHACLWRHGYNPRPLHHGQRLSQLTQRWRAGMVATEQLGAEGYGQGWPCVGCGHGVVAA